jgi:hypothetical protein
METVVTSVQVAIVSSKDVPEPEYIAGLAYAYFRGELLMRPLAKQLMPP